MILLERYNTSSKRDVRWIYLLSFVFIAANIVLISYNQWWLGLLPAALIIGLLWFLALDKLLLLTVFLTPLSLTLDQIGAGTTLSLPAEPLMLLITTLFIIRQLFVGDYDRKAIFHPLSILIFFNLFWMGFTALTSELPIVSVKYFISRLWFVIPFYFLALQMFRNYDNIGRYIWAYILPLLMVICYASVGLWQTGFDEQLSQSVMTPFYPSHTSYGAIIAMFLPFIIILTLKPEQFNISKYTALAIGFCFSFAIIFTYSRAVWISLPAAVGIFFILKFRIKFRTIIIVTLACLSVLMINLDDLIMSMERNKQDSSEDLVENFQSISNITTDDSNTERLNRWSSAIAMFWERPILGWGPGTYQFEYAPFQEAKNLTLISTNAGDLGNAHSEYIGPMSESGLLGGLSIIAIICYFIYMGVNITLYAREERIRLMALSLLLGLSTYFIHGFLNNYLDTDKASVPFWGFMAMMTALDLYHARYNKASPLAKDLEKLNSE